MPPLEMFLLILLCPPALLDSDLQGRRSWNVWEHQTFPAQLSKVRRQVVSQRNGSEINVTAQDLNLEDAGTTIETTIATNGENMILQQIENNEDNEKQLVDSLEEVIKDLSDLYHDISFNESIDYDHEYVSDYVDHYDLTTITDEIDITTIINDARDTLITSGEDEVTLESETAVTDAPLADPIVEAETTAVT